MKQFLSSVPVFFFLWIVLLIQSCTSSTAIIGRWQIVSFDNGRIHVNYSTDTAWLYPAMKKQLEDREEDTNKILQDSKEAFRSFGFQFNEDGTYEKFISPGKKMEG